MTTLLSYKLRWLNLRRLRVELWLTLKWNINKSLVAKCNVKRLESKAIRSLTSRL